MLHQPLSACSAGSRLAQTPLSSRSGARAALRPARARAARPAASGRGAFSVLALGKSPEEVQRLAKEYEEAMKDPAKAAALKAQAEAYKKARDCRSFAGASQEALGTR